MELRKLRILKSEITLHVELILVAVLTHLPHIDSFVRIEPHSFGLFFNIAWSFNQTMRFSVQFP